MKRDKKYPNGYQPKIDFYTYKIENNSADLDCKSFSFYSKKRSYFLQKQKQTLELS